MELANVFEEPEMKKHNSEVDEETKRLIQQLQEEEKHEVD